jgi:hypothetical protein
MRDEIAIVGILVHGDNHFIVSGPLPDREIAIALVRQWSLIQIGAATSPSFDRWHIVSREFRDMPIECKRLPTPKGTDRDEREYVISRHSSTGGIQRFKDGNHASTHTVAAMIGYLREETTAVWETRVSGWINALAGVEPGWTAKDLLGADRNDAALRLAVYHSSHERQKGLSEIELRHLWLEMN